MSELETLLAIIAGLLLAYGGAYWVVCNARYTRARLDSLDTTEPGDLAARGYPPQANEHDGQAGGGSSASGSHRSRRSPSS